MPAAAQARRFITVRNGNIATLFALMLTPLVLASGVALDFLRYAKAKVEIEQAADSGLLAAARSMTADKTLTLADGKRIARDYFDSNVDIRARIRIDSFDFAGDRNTGDFSVRVSGVQDTAIMKIVGQKTLDLQVDARARISPPRDLEAMLVLDATDSMEGSRIQTLRRAARNLARQLMTDDAENVKIGIVPFARYVNVGLSRRNEPWINVPADETRTESVCRNTYPNKRKTGRKVERTRTEKYNCRRVPSTCNRDGRSFSCTRRECDTRAVTELVDEVDRGAPVRVCEDRQRTRVWNGCVGSRNAPLNIEDRDFRGANRAIGLLDVNCPPEVTPLSDRRRTVLNAVKALDTEGETYIPAGLTWGLRLLSSGAPFTEGLSYAEADRRDSVKALLLMTDGANTKSPTFPTHNGGNEGQANQISLDLCTEIKGNNIEVYTIAFEVTDATIRNLLEDCATSPANYFDARNAAQLSDAFDAVAASLSDLALTQ